MSFIELLSGVVILSFCIFLIGLAVTIVVNPQRAERFLKLYASTARAHYTEQAARLAVGMAFVALAPSMRFSNLLGLFGWILIATTLGLLLIPWQWHHKFGEWAIPLALRQMKLYALGAFLLGAFILYSLSGIPVS